MIDLRDDHMKLVRCILAEHVSECGVGAFGSRVTWTTGNNPDLDLVVVGAGKLDWRTMAGIRNAFEELILPFRVDILDWHAIPRGLPQKHPRCIRGRARRQPLGNSSRELT